STVSKALRDSHEISEETKKKVKELANKLGYKPNPHAASLRNKKSQMIAVIIPEISNNFFALAIDGIEEVVRQEGYQLLIYLSHESHQKEVEILEKMDGRVDGVLMCMATETNEVSHIRSLKDKRIPLVFFDRVSEKISTVKVVTDDLESAYKATQHLMAKGAKKIAYLSLSLNISVDQHRMQGFLKAASEHSFSHQQKKIVTCGIDDEANFNLIKNLLTGTDVPDAIFACVERLAITAYLVCKDLGLVIGKDLRLITFSNLQAAPILDPPLTAVSQPAYEIGNQAAKVLVNALKKNQVDLQNERIVIPSILIERESTL
ncbi:MAG TPA: LacI family DNA-binding transcriptional regulator, partial [Pelobium sp.]